VVLAGNGRIKPNTVIVDGKPELHREGAYYLEWREGLRSLGVRIPPPLRTICSRPPLPGITGP